MIHVVNRRSPFDPLSHIGASKLKLSLERLVLPTLRSLPPTVALFWLAAAARPSQTPQGKPPFSNEGLGGQLWGQLKREISLSVKDKGEPWPAFRMAPSKGEKTPPSAFVEAFCTPLALAVTALDSAVAPAAKVEAVVKEVQGKNKISDAAVGNLTARRLQEFHTVLGMMWSLAYSATDPTEFDLTITSLEMLLAAELLSSKGLTLPATFPQEVLTFLLSPARPKYEDPPRGIELAKKSEQPRSPKARAAGTPATEASDEGSGSEEGSPPPRRKSRRPPQRSLVGGNPTGSFPPRQRNPALRLTRITVSLVMSPVVGYGNPVLGSHVTEVTLKPSTEPVTVPC
jgi:hypothetical protein